MKQSLYSTTFEHRPFLEQVPLDTEEAVLRYFDLSPFRAEQGETAVVLRGSLEDGWIIEKTRGTGLQGGVFYVMRGIVYAAPPLHEVIETRLTRCVDKLREALQAGKVRGDGIFKEDEEMVGEKAKKHEILRSIEPKPLPLHHTFNERGELLWGEGVGDFNKVLQRCIQNEGVGEPDESLKS